MKNSNSYLLFFAGLFSVLLIGSNFMAVKLFDIFGLTLPVAVICYPLCFMISDVINEFWGFKTTRRIIVYTFIFNAILVIFLTIAVFIPPSVAYPDNDAFRAIFLSVPRILISSFVAFLIGGFLDAYVFDKIKEKGKSKLGMRAAVSTLLGIITDSVIFITCAFAFTLPLNVLLLTILGQVLAKILLGIGIGTPLTVLIAKLLTKNEPSQNTESV